MVVKEGGTLLKKSLERFPPKIIPCAAAGTSAPQ
jgi:hypothetical protein